MRTFFTRSKEAGLLALLLCLCISLSADPNDNVLNGEWPVVGQGYGNLGNAPSTIDSSNAGNLLNNQKFFFQTAGPVLAQPAISNGVAYFADIAGTLYAIDITTGQQIWSVFLGNEFITTPSVSEDMVYISGGTLVYTFAGSPVKVFGVNRSDGSLVWSSKIDPLSGTIPGVGDYTGDTTIVGDLIIFGVASLENFSSPSPDYKSRGSVVAFNRFTGEQEWRFYTTSDQLAEYVEYGAGAGAWSSPAIDLERRLLFIGTGQNYELPCSPYANSLLAIDYKNGNLRWFSQLTVNDVWDSVNNPSGMNWDVGCHPNLFSAVVEGDGLVDFVGVAEKGGRYFIMRRDQRHSSTYLKGEPKIDAVIFLDEGSKAGAIQSTPTIDNVNKILYVASDALVGPLGVRTSINAVQLNYPIESTEFQGEVIPKISAYDLTKLVNGSLANDALIWEQSSTTDPNNRGQNYGPLTFCNDVIFVTNGTGNVRILKALDGTVIDETKPLGNSVSIFGGVTVVGEQIFVPTVGGIASYALP